MNKIFIHDLRVEARIGVYDWERHLPQTIRLDLELGAPSEKPFATGRIADALDYAKVVERLKAFAKDAPPPLLERFAEKVAQLVLTEFEPAWVRVRVAKLGALAGGKEIGVESERTRSQWSNAELGGTPVLDIVVPAKAGTQWRTSKAARFQPSRERRGLVVVGIS